MYPNDVLTNANGDQYFEATQRLPAVFSMCVKLLACSTAGSLDSPLGPAQSGLLRYAIAYQTDNATAPSLSNYTFVSNSSLVRPTNPQKLFPILSMHSAAR